MVKENYTFDKEGMSIRGQKTHKKYTLGDKVKFTVKNADMMLKQGGFLNPGNFKEFKKIKIEYLCDQTSSYKPCVQQHPGLISDIESQLYEKINKI